MTAIPQDVLGFWKNAGSQKWFAHSWAFDDAIRLKFEPVHHRAARGEYDAWAAEPESALALLILLDQFPRNLYRNTPRKPPPSHPERQYLNLLADILENGVQRGDRTGTGTLGVFGRQIRFDLSQGLPGADHQEAAPALDHHRAAVVPARRHQRALPAGQRLRIWDEWADENGDLGPGLRQAVALVGRARRPGDRPDQQPGREA
jgi:hypothetical protein